ncbi:MAG: 30S ribosomal protein S19 [Nanoarchaeota archaeon]|nr:30S ribosomal protein S19 [Nanoarchaeota archaeon]MBU1704088.1 30S ribosomal protein S19 [Nanoarchaeota archaeon]
MAKKEFSYYGKTLEELKAMDIKEFADLLPSRLRRTIKRGFSEEQKGLLEKVKAKEKNIKTHCRTMVILPEMVDATIKVYNGKSFENVIIDPDMLGHVLGEFVLTRKKLAHSAPGVGATKSSSNLSVK